MGIGKYVTNFGVISALLGGLSTMKQTQAMPKDWRRYLVWVVWVAGLVLTVMSVAKKPEDERFEEELRAAEKQAKLEAKALKKAR